MNSIKAFGTLVCVLCLGQASARYAQANSAGSNPIASVSTGQLRSSLTADGVAVFKNIPFAQPPVGDLRWREPVPAKYWTNFAKTGDPNGGSLVKWPKFDGTKRAYLDFTDAGPLAKEGLRRQVCDVFMENEKRTSTK